MIGKPIRRLVSSLRHQSFMPQQGLKFGQGRETASSHWQSRGPHGRPRSRSVKGIGANHRHTLTQNQHSPRAPDLMTNREGNRESATTINCACPNVANDATYIGRLEYINVLRIVDQINFCKLFD